MAFLSVSEAARRLGKNERTIRRWIDSGALEGSHSVNGRLIIDEAEIARLIGELEKLAGNDQAQRVDELAALVARVDALEAGQARLQHGLDVIQEMLSTRPSKRIAPRQSSPPVPTSHNTPVQHSLLNDEDVTQGNQPASTISLADLATALGISRTTLLGHVLKAENGLSHIAIASETRPGEFKRYFTDDQAQAVKRWHAARSKKRPAQEE